jgi:hypothetical protein
MTRNQTTTTLAMLTVGLMLAVGRVGAGQNAGEVALRAAVERQTMTGDVRGAISAFRALSGDSDRAVAAQALLHLAAAYDVIGEQAHARTEYAELVQRFPDHPAAAEARVRLTELGLPGQAALQRAASTSRAQTSTGDRVVWAGSEFIEQGRVSPDGRFLVATDWNSGNLVLHDLENGASRVLAASVASLKFARRIG